jgi:hypothetical protein
VVKPKKDYMQKMKEDDKKAYDYIKNNPTSTLHAF